MVGKPARDEAKSAVINIRVTPTLKAKLEAHGRIHGRSLSGECEERLLRSMEMTETPSASPETEELLAEVARLIGEIEEATQHKWHEGAMTWAAVAEMMATGPIMARAPRHIGEDDGKLAALYEKAIDLEDERKVIDTELAITGISNALLMLFGRERVDERLAQLNYPTELNERIAAQLDRLQAIKTEMDGVMEKIDAIIEPFREAVENGRRLYDKPKTGLALKSVFNRLSGPSVNALASYALRPAPSAASLRAFHNLTSPPDALALHSLFAPDTGQTKGGLGARFLANPIGRALASPLGGSKRDDDA